MQTIARANVRRSVVLLVSNTKARREKHAKMIDDMNATDDQKNGYIKCPTHVIWVPICADSAWVASDKEVVSAVVGQTGEEVAYWHECQVNSKWPSRFNIAVVHVTHDAQDGLSLYSSMVFDTLKSDRPENSTVNFVYTESELLRWMRGYLCGVIVVAERALLDTNEVYMKSTLDTVQGLTQSGLKVGVCVVFQKPDGLPQYALGETAELVAERVHIGLTLSAETKMPVVSISPVQIKRMWNMLNALISTAAQKGADENFDAIDFESSTKEWRVAWSGIQKIKRVTSSSSSNVENAEVASSVASGSSV
jgi:hypothetical protein